ncbi:MAG: hypothetical protein LKJ17_05325 [Oscillospiraceae bacterium]|nr:hypothetical protein [Oscillospiraceae bacterium]
MGYVYVVLWIGVGAFLIFRMGKESRVFYPIGGFFLLLGVWWAAGVYTGLNLFSGAWGWALRAVTAVTLVLACAEFIKDVRRTRGGK